MEERGHDSESPWVERKTAGGSPMGDCFFVAPAVMESPLPLGGETG